jgi:tetratricopeptide (TPR) repeat protein
VSPKNKGKFGKGKSKIEEEDEFVSTMHKVTGKLAPHAWPIAVGIAILAIILTSYFTYNWWQNKKATKATTQYAQAAAIMQVPVYEPLEDDEPEQLEEGELPSSYPTTEARAQAALDLLDNLSSGRITGASRLLRATALLDVGRTDEAIEQYGKYARGAKGGIKSMANERLGYAYEAVAAAAGDDGARKQALEDALEAFRSIQTNDDGPRRDYALYHEGRILAALDKKDEAIAAFEKARAIPTTLLESEIEQHIIQLTAPEPPPELAPEPDPDPKDGADETPEPDGAEPTEPAQE